MVVRTENHQISDITTILSDLARLLQVHRSFIYTVPPSNGRYLRRKISILNDDLLNSVSNLCIHLRRTRTDDISSDQSTNRIKTFMGQVWTACDKLIDLDINEQKAVLCFLNEWIETLDDAIVEMNELLEQSETEETVRECINEFTDSLTQSQATSRPESPCPANISSRQSAHATLDTCETEEEKTKSVMDSVEEIFQKLMQNSGSLTPVEAMRAKKCLRLVKDSRLLLKKVGKRCIEETCSENAQSDIQWMEDVMELAQRLCALVDDVGCACMGPQDVTDIVSCKNSPILI